MTTYLYFRSICIFQKKGLLSDDQNAVSYTGREHWYNVAHQYRSIPSKKYQKPQSNSVTKVMVPVKLFGWQGKCCRKKTIPKKVVFYVLQISGHFRRPRLVQRLCFWVLQEAPSKLMSLQETLFPDNTWPKREGSHPAPNCSPNTKLATQTAHPLLWDAPWVWFLAQ